MLERIQKAQIVLLIVGLVGVFSGLPPGFSGGSP